MSKSIAHAATTIRHIEKARFYRSQAEVRLCNDLLRQPGHAFEAARITTTLRSYSLANVVLDGDTGFIFQDETVIPETTYAALRATDRATSTERKHLIKLDPAQDHIIGYNAAHASYQHWLTQCLPAIDWAVRQPRTRNLRLVLPPLAPWQEDLLEILGYSQIPRFTLKPGMLCLIPHAEYSEFLNGSASFDVCLSVRETARRMLQHVPQQPSPHRILVVPCANPYYGRIRNEPEIIDLLRGYGAHVVDPHLTAAERINLFRQADVVIGPFGQGLSDVLFCRPNTLLWEWMPRHYHNASINRLAQTAALDYWGDLFESDPAPDASGQWVVNPDTVTLGMAEITQRLERPVTTKSPPDPLGRQVIDKSIDEIMLAFESLGDNCEFGFVQRHAGIEPLGLLRFAGIHLDQLVNGLATKFPDLGSIDAIRVYPAGSPGRRELMVHETSIDMRYHTFIREGEVDPDEFREREARRLGFLRRKLLDDLAVGEKIWVWRELDVADPARLQPLLGALRNLGPNVLLWVVEADANHPPGTLEHLEHDFLKGYVERLARYEAAADIEPFSWFEVCTKAFAARYPDQSLPDPVAATPPPAAMGEMPAADQAPPQRAIAAPPASTDTVSAEARPSVCPPAAAAPTPEPADLTPADPPVPAATVSIETVSAALKLDASPPAPPFRTPTSSPAAPVAALAHPNPPRLPAPRALAPADAPAMPVPPHIAARPTWLSRLGRALRL